MNETNWWWFLIVFVVWCLFIAYRALPKYLEKDWRKPVFVPGDNGDVEVDISPQSDPGYKTWLEERKQIWEEKQKDILIKGAVLSNALIDRIYMYLIEAPKFSHPRRTNDSVTFSYDYYSKYDKELLKDIVVLRNDKVRENLLKSLVGSLKDRGWNYIELRYIDRGEQESEIKLVIGQAKKSHFSFTRDTSYIEHDRITMMTSRGKITTKPVISWIKQTN